MALTDTYLVLLCQELGSKHCIQIGLFNFHNLSI